MDVKHKIIAAVTALGIAFVSSVSIAPVANAQPAQSGGGTCGGGSVLMLPPWYKGLPCDSEGNISAPNDIGEFVWRIALNIVEMLLYVIGYVSLAFVIWGGFKYLISGDDANGVAGAKKTILNAIIGLILSIMSVGIVNVITGVV